MSLTRVQLENPGDLWANIAKTILLADSPAWPFTPYAHREFGSAMANNRVEITAMDEGRASGQMDFANIANAQVAFYSHRSVRLAFGVVSSRADQNVTDNHAYCLGRLGYLCSRDAQKFTPAACQNLHVLDIEDVDTSPTEDLKTDRDRSTRHFRIQYVTPATVYAAAT